MSDLKTINLKGKEYVPVSERVKHFSEHFKAGSIKTEVISQNNSIVCFKAIATPDIAFPDRYFTGHSFGTIDEVKAFEKLETVSVGRALALMGIGVVDSIASADEMQVFHSKPVEKSDKKAGLHCDKCNSPMNLVKAGISKKTGKAYNAFFACSNKNCKRTMSTEVAEEWRNQTANQVVDMFAPDVPPPLEYT